MPWAAIAAIAGLASAGAGIGESIYSATQNHNPTQTPATTPTTPTVPQPPSQSQLNQIRAAQSSEAPNILGATSGLASPDYLKEMIQLLSGTANQTGAAGQASSVISSIYGSGAGGGGNNGFVPNVPSPTSPTSPTFTPAGGGGQSASPGIGTGGFSDFVGQFLYGGQ